MPLFRRDRREPSVISRADRAREAGQWELAAGLYRVALDRTPRNPPIWIQYGHALKEMGDRTAAEAAYRNAIAYHPDDPDAYLQLGHVLKLQGKIAEARAAYQRALVLDASCADASRELNELQRDPDRSNGFGMMGSGETLPTSAMGSPGVRRQLRRGKGSLISRADRAREAQQWDIAADLYRRALDRNPDRPDIWVQYGHALKESGNPVEAERAYRAAIARDPGAAEPHLQLGHVLKLQGKQEEAEAAYLRAFALDPGLPHPGAGLHGLGWSETRFAELRRMVPDTPNSIVSTHALSNGSGSPVASVPRIGGTTIDTLRASAVVTDQGLFSLPIEQQAKCLREAGLFDSEWYLSRYPDVAATGIDPVQHFLSIGAAEGRKPNSNFETARYCDAFPELARTGINPLLHALARQRQVRAPDLSGLHAITPSGSIAIVLHLFAPDLWDEMRQALEQVREPYDLFVSLTRGSSDYLRRSILQAFPRAYIFDFENHGRDVGTFLAFLQSGVLFKYDVVCKIHTKRSPHRSDGDNWRRALMAGVLGSSGVVDRVVANFRADPELGLVVAKGYLHSGAESWSGNDRWLNRLLPRLGFPPDVNDCAFPAGNIFWIRTSLLRKMASLGLQLSDFEPEPLFVDGGLGHAIERVFGLLCRHGGMRAVEHTELLSLSEAVLRARIAASGLFDPAAYLELNPDLPRDPVDAWHHFLRYGLGERRAFTNPLVVARLLAQMDAEIRAERHSLTQRAEAAAAHGIAPDSLSRLRGRGTRVGVFCSSLGNFFMREIADLLAWGLRAEGIDAVQRDEQASRDERFDLRVFVAPHEFFWLGEGRDWTELAAAPGSVLYNVEQPQTQWFCRAFPLLLEAPLVLDINLQSAMILRRAGCNVMHFMPGHLPSARYAQPCLDISDVPLARGYAFARQSYDWQASNRLDERPIDILFIGTRAPRRDKALLRLQELMDRYRFLCVYRSSSLPITEQSAVAAERSWALAQRAKIVLNLHRDWIGYFEWPRIVMHGFWQGACVVSDPGLSSPIFEPGTHYLEENLRHIGELMRWLLETPEGQGKLDQTRIAAYEQARSVGSMHIALTPVLDAFAAELRI